MWLSDIEVVTYIVVVSLWFHKQGHPIPIQKLGKILRCWQENCTIQVFIDEVWWVDLYSPHQLPMADVYVGEVYDPHLSSELKKLLEDAHSLLSSPG